MAIKKKAMCKSCPVDALLDSDACCSKCLNCPDIFKENAAVRCLHDFVPLMESIIPEYQAYLDTKGVPEGTMPDEVFSSIAQGYYNQWLNEHPERPRIRHTRGTMVKSWRLFLERREYRRLILANK